MSNRPPLSKSLDDIAGNPKRITISPFESEMLSRSGDNSILDLGIGLLEEIVGTSLESVSTDSRSLLCQTSGARSDLALKEQTTLNIMIDQALMVPQDTMYVLTDQAFNTCYQLNEIVPRTEFRSMVDSLYAVEPAFWNLEEYDNIALLSAVLALAHSVDWKVHQTLGCPAAIAKSEAYFQTANGILERNKHQVTSLTQLRTVMSMMLYQLITKNAAATSDLLNIACMATINLGIYDEFFSSGRIEEGENTPSQNMLWTVLYFDMYLCGLLARPNFVDASKSEESTLSAIQRAARNVSNYVRSSQSFILKVGLALQIELFKLMRQGARAKQRDNSVELRRVKQDLMHWEALFTSIFPQDETIKVVARTRFELRMCHHLAAISLSSPYIKFANRESRIRYPETSLRAELGKWCIENAMQAIDATVAHGRLPGHAPIVQPSAYALFVAVVCLVKASGFVEEKSGILIKMYQGLQLLTDIACSALGETQQYVKFIQEMASSYELLDIESPFRNTQDFLPAMTRHKQLAP